MKMMMRTAATLFVALSFGFAAQAAKSVELRNEEVVKIDKALKALGVDGVRLSGLDALADANPDLKSAYNEVAKTISEHPQFFKTNKDAVTKLINQINGATGGAADVRNRMKDGSLEFASADVQAKSEKVLKAIEGLPGILSTIVAGKNGDIARATKVATILSSVSRATLAKGSSEANVLAQKLEGTPTNPATVDDVILLINKALSENRTDGKKFSIDDLIEACLNGMKKA